MATGTAGRYVYRVSELVDILARELEAAFPDVWVEGEVASLKTAVSGHVYFLLKGDKASLRVVLFRNHALRIPFRPENGMQALVRGKVSLYRASGDLQLYATLVEPAGLGAMQAALEQAKRRLMEAGLTDAAGKRPIPPFPTRVGIVTSLEGAALQDILTVLRRRGAGFEVVIAPSLVQGDGAPAALLQALRRIGRVRGIEVVLLTRGGGSATDLWAFNDEALAREVAACPVPVISAVGHEVDNVLTDLTADLRAPTPSAAAEMLTGRQETVRQAAENLQAGLKRRVLDLLALHAERADRGSPIRLETLLRMRIDSHILAIERIEEGLVRSARDRWTEAGHRAEVCSRAFSPDSLSRWLESVGVREGALSRRLSAWAGEAVLAAGKRRSEATRMLLSLRPSSVLARGFAAVFDDSGKLVTGPSQAPPGTPLSVALRGGGLLCRSEAGAAPRIPKALIGEPPQED